MQIATNIRLTWTAPETLHILASCVLTLPMLAERKTDWECPCELCPFRMLGQSRNSIGQLRGAESWLWIDGTAKFLDTSSYNGMLEQV